jgi:DNA-binding transcriptional ArsR family regulator
MVNYRDLDAAFGALADPTRRRIIEKLARGSATAGELAAGFSISQPAISRHLRVLEASGLMKRRVNGRVHHCSLAPDALAATSAWIERQRSFWTATLDRLDAHLTRSPKKRKRS